MTVDASTIDPPLGGIGHASPVAPAPLAMSVRWKIFTYLGILIVLLGFGSPAGGLIGLPISFFLKNKLHLKAHEVAIFGLLASTPVYLSFAFGFARDTFNPFGMKDRGFMVLFGAISVCVYLVFTFIPPTYFALLAAMVMLGASFLFIMSALRGLTSTIGQQHVMSGQVSALWNIFEALPAIAALLAGGLLSELMEGAKAAEGARILFLAGAAIMAAIAIYGFWRPASVFDNVHSERITGERPADDFKRLVRHWPIYPALLIWLLWNFVPGFSTPLQYFFQNTLRGSDAQWGQWWAIYYGSGIPMFLVFGVLCRRFPLKRLLFWGTVAALPMMVPLLLIRSVTGAMLCAAPMGLMAGVASASYLDLIIRSCPRGLQGTVLMASVGLTTVDVRFGDVLGTTLYDHFGGFTVCVIAMTVTNALILPALLLIPKRLVATSDGQAAGEG